MNTFGIYCWHAYNTNPKIIEILISDNNKNMNNFKSLGIFELEMRDGIQLFSIDYNVLDDLSIKNKIKAIKLIIKNAFGGDKTYINQIMFYENSIKEMNIINESIQSNSNSFQNAISLPEDLSNSQISEEEKEKEKEKQEIEKNGKNANGEPKNFKKIKNNDYYINIHNKKENLNNKIKKQNIVDYISEINSKYSDINDNKSINKKDKNESIKVEENDIINDNSNNENNEEEEEIEEEEKEENENEEANQIIPTSDELKYPYENKFEKKTIKKKNNSNHNQKQNLNENIINKNKKEKKINKLEKILKQNILRNENKKINKNDIYLDNMNNNQIEDLEEAENENKFNFPKNRTINTINEYYSLTPILRNNYNTQDINERNSNKELNNNFQKYFQLNSNTPNRFTISGYEFLNNKKRPNTPNLNEINIIQPQNKIVNNEYKNKTSMVGFNNNNFNNDIKNSKAYETLEVQLKDMEKYLQNMALNRDISSNSNLNYISKTNRENKIESQNYNSDLHINNNYIDKKAKSKSMISNASSYINEEQKNINTNLSNNIYNNSNNNYFNKYNSQNSYLNNDDDNIELNKRIDDLEKNIFEIKDELNNINTNLNIFFNKDNFLNNFKESIKQICYDFFNERINNIDNHNNEIIKKENEKDNENENENQKENENEEDENSQNSGEYSEVKNNQNENNKIEEEINKKIDEKLEYLCDNLQTQIFEKYLQPSINEIEKSMKQNIEDIKEKVDSINYINNSKKIKNNNNYNSIIDYNNNDIFQSSLDLNYKKEGFNSKGDNYHKNSSKIKKEKYEEINRLGEQLYGKLLEKEKKLKLLREETMKNREKNINEQIY